MLGIDSLIQGVIVKPSRIDRFIEVFMLLLSLWFIVVFGCILKSLLMKGDYLFAILAAFGLYFWVRSLIDFGKWFFKNDKK